MNSVSVYLDADDSELRWGLLPSRIRQVVGSEVEWMRVLRAHALTVQMEWCHPIGGDEGTYLEEVVRSSREVHDIPLSPGQQGEGDTIRVLSRDDHRNHAQRAIV